MLYENHSTSKASDFIHFIGDAPPGLPFVLWLRVSSRVQNHNGNFAGQEETVREAAKGHPVLKTFRHVGNGAHPSDLFAEAVAYAKRYRAGILAESLSRYSRHINYHSSRNPNAQPELRQLKGMQKVLQGVPAYTVLHPDATPQQERAFQTNRGKQKRRGPMPYKTAGYKKRKRLRLLPKTLLLHRQGRSLGEIARILHIPRSTVQDWVRGVH